MEIFFRCIVIFVVLFLIVKLLGKKQIKHMTLYDYIVGITIGSIAADTIVSLDFSLWDGVFALFFFGGLGYLVSIISFYFHETESFMDGKPILLFEKNHFILENLEKAKMSSSQILEHLRLKGCFDITDLDTALLEPSGEISVLMKPKAQSISPNDLKKNVKKKSKKQTMCYSVITDGVIDEEQLQKAKKSKKWLDEYLKSQHIALEDVTLLSVDQNGKATLY